MCWRKQGHRSSRRGVGALDVQPVCEAQTLRVLRVASHLSSEAEKASARSHCLLEGGEGLGKVTLSPRRRRRPRKIGAFPSSPPAPLSGQSWTRVRSPPRASVGPELYVRARGLSRPSIASGLTRASGSPCIDGVASSRHWFEFLEPPAFAWERSSATRQTSGCVSE